MEVSVEKLQQERKSVKHLFPSAPPKSLPGLIFLHGKREQYQTFYSLSDNNYQTKSIPDMRRKFMKALNFGWMFLLDSDYYSDDCFLLNPTTMEKIQLPPWRSSTDDCRCHQLTSPPTTDPDPSSSNCAFLFFSNRCKGTLSIRFCNPGVTNWSYQELKWSDYHLDRYEDGIRTDTIIYDAISCQGKTYIVLFPLKIVALNIVGSSITLEDLRIDKLPRTQLLNLEIFMLKFSYLGIDKIHCKIDDIKVCNLDLSKKVWTLVKSIGDRAFFTAIGLRCNFSCSAKDNPTIKPNTVCFTLPNDRILYPFHLEEESITIYPPCPDVQSNWSQPQWFLPQPNI